MIAIDEDCSVNAYSVLQSGGNLRVGKKTRIGPRTVIEPSDHVFADPDIPIKDQGLSQIGITIEARVLGQGCVVAAGAVVTNRFRL